MNPQRAVAKQNLLVATVNTALERGLITLECRPVASVAFEFNIEMYPVVASVADAGFDEVATACKSVRSTGWVTRSSTAIKFARCSSSKRHRGKNEWTSRRRRGPQLLSRFASLERVL
jgi:hypothetical protein